MTPGPFDDALVLTGPTGSGKTELGIELALRLNAEIVSMDSMAVYRRMDIGTAKPTRGQREAITHHLVDVLDPWQSASVAWWLREAEVCCREIVARGKRVLFVGGTPLYLKALLFGLFDGPPADAQLRKRLTEEAQRWARPRFMPSCGQSIRSPLSDCTPMMADGSSAPWRSSSSPGGPSAPGKRNG